MIPLEIPDLLLLEWEADASSRPESPEARCDAGAIGSPGTRGEPEPETTPAALDPMRQRLRDRYISARFPEVAGSSADLEDSRHVIKAVRLYFEEQELDRADELLELAIQQAPREKPLRLAQLELAFLQRDAARFTALARTFHRLHADSREWQEIARLGRALAPAQTLLFGDAQGARAHDQYGPWPDMPNWLQASWDLTAEVLGADLHREMARGRTPANPLKPNATTPRIDS